MPFKPVQKIDAMEPRHGMPLSKLAAEVTTMLPICPQPVTAQAAIARSVLATRIFNPSRHQQVAIRLGL
jgi:hypothetical protein